MATESDVIRQSVLEIYDEIARADEANFGCGCGPADGSHLTVAVASTRMGYSQKELDALPDGSDLGLGCGNPQAIAVLQPGETVLDLGSGAGIDCFLAARQVTGSGRVIGVDMTASMAPKARANAATVTREHVESRRGEIAHPPAAAHRRAVHCCT